MGLLIFSDDDIERIHLATAKVLEETGIKVYGDEAMEIYSAGGCSVNKETGMVKIPSSVLEDSIRSCPGKVLLAGRDPILHILQ